MERRPRLRAAPIKTTLPPFSALLLRLAAQDVALSRRKQGFESPCGSLQLFQWVRRVALEEYRIAACSGGNYERQRMPGEFWEGIG